LISEIGRRRRITASHSLKAFDHRQGARFGVDGPIGWLCRGHGESRGLLLLRKARLRKRRENYQAVIMRDQEIRAIVAETLAEQQRLQHESIDAIVLKAVASILSSFGIDEADRRELSADFQHLRRWRKSVEQAQSYTFKAVITVIVTGLVGAVWLGIKVMLAK
jgi:hypothetical protein